jgi:hypothetical protein
LFTVRNCLFNTLVAILSLRSMTLHLPLEGEERPSDKAHTYYKHNRCCVTSHKVMYHINLTDEITILLTYSYNDSFGVI